MRCPKYLMHCPKYLNIAAFLKNRTRVIHSIRNCVKEHCAHLQTKESFIDPSQVRRRYPFNITSTSMLYSLKSIAITAANLESVEDPFVFSSNEPYTGIALKTLLKFEPYAILPASIVQVICNQRDPTYNTTISDRFITQFTQKVHKCPVFNKVVCDILKLQQDEPAEQEILNFKLKQWRDTCHVTYQQLHKYLDQFSIFAGINIVVRLMQIL